MVSPLLGPRIWAPAACFREVSRFCGALRQARKASIAARSLSRRAVELLPGAGDFRLIAGGPLPERRDRLQQIAAERGERIIDPRRGGREHGARGQAVALEPTQGQRQHALGNAADRAPQLIEAHRTGTEPRHHQDRPLVADPGQHVTDGAAVGGQSIVPRFHRCALLCAFPIVTYVAPVTYHNRGFQPCPSPPSPSSSARTARNRSTANMPRRWSSSAPTNSTPPSSASTTCRCTTRITKPITAPRGRASRT